VDYSTASDNIAQISQMLFWMMKRSNMFDVNIFDESYGLLRHIQFTRPLLDVIKRNRSARKLIVLITHRLSDIASLPDETRALALSVFKEIPVWMVGKLSPSDVALLREHRDISDKVANSIQNLKRREFYVVFGSNTEPVKFESYVPQRMLQHTFSNQALAAELGRSTH
jgi:ABC-type sugar transport system ATPase subunit